MSRTRWIPSIVLFLSLAPLPPAVAGADAPPPATGEASAAVGEPVAPAFRFERHLAAGKAYLESLPEGTRITIHRNDGTSFSLVLRGGTLLPDPDLPRMRKDGNDVVTPLGHRLRLGRAAGGRLRATITTPSGTTTQVTRRGEMLMVVTRGGRNWSYSVNHELVLRLTDGTEITVTDRARKWTVTDLHGARFRWEAEDPRWIELPALPSPPLVPRFVGYYYQAGDGDEWRRPVREDHLVFAWNWYPLGLPLARLLAEVQQEPRLHDVRFQYERIPRMQPPPDEAAVLVGRRFALCGGDRVTFEVPGKEPVTCFLFPGPIDPDYTLPRLKLPGAIPLPRQKGPSRGAR